MVTHLLFIGSTELFIVLLIVILLFGADKLPEIARGLGKGIRHVKDATNEIKKEITESTKEETKVLKDINKEIEEVKDVLQGPVKRNR